MHTEQLKTDFSRTYITPPSIAFEFETLKFSAEIDEDLDILMTLPESRVRAVFTVALVN